MKLQNHQKHSAGTLAAIADPMHSRNQGAAWGWINLLLPLFLLLQAANASVIVTTPSNASLPFSDMEAGFTPRVPQAGIVGLLYLSNPLDACQPLHSGPILDKSPFSTFVLVQRGVCKFDEKVRHAQDAGFQAAIVFNNDDDRDLVIMSGQSVGIKIPAVFVSKAAGAVLSDYAGDPNTRCYIFPTMDYPAWSVMAVAFISLLAVVAVLATFFFVRRHRLRRLGSRLLQARDPPPGLSPAEVKALPTFHFSLTDDSATAAANTESCVICMEDYENGHKLRLLPCRHAFHAACIDQWLTKKPFCPVCKRDAHSKAAEGPCMTENTPLLTPRSIAPPPPPPAATAVSIVSSAPAATQTSPSPSPSPSQSSFQCSCSPIAVPLSQSGGGLHRCSSLVTRPTCCLAGPSTPGRSNACSSWPRSNADLLC